MANSVPDESKLTITPLGAGDLIDRAVRFYRRYFWTFVLIAAPPVVVGTLVSVGWTIVSREIFSVGPDRFSAENTFYFFFVWLGAIVIWLVETVATLVVMGGASRNFVRHLLLGEAISFRETYRNAWKRLASLIVASTIITVVLGSIGVGITYFGILLGMLLIILIVAVFSFVPVVAVILSVVVGLAVAAGTLWLYFLVASRVAYVPQVMLVEGLGVFPAIGRSVSLASGNVSRLMALFLFSTVATYSALALLFVPLAWYASASGVEVMTFYSDIRPAWYEIASNLLWQISFILLSPVWTVGLCLLYVDERVRHEGYDIELMAAARLGEIPSVPEAYINPLQPAVSSSISAKPRAVAAERSSITTLGLK